MANFTTIEKEMMEDVFDMRCGHVLDFSKKSFAGFIQENLGIDVYSNLDLAGKSNAKILRAILSDISDECAGKVLLNLIEYRNFKDIKNEGDKYLDKIKDIANLKSKSAFAEQCNNLDKPKPIVSVNHSELLSLLKSIESSSLTNQKKGYAFEKFLKSLFEAYTLNPRISYRTGSDQIDGSFEFNGLTCLLEAKYRGTAPTKDDLILFRNKLDRKSSLVRGVFICLSNISNNVIDFFREKENKKIIVITVEELYSLLQNKKDFVELLKAKFRYLDETGIIFVNCKNLIFLVL